MLAWQRPSLRRFTSLYAFKDWRSICVHTGFGCAAFALALLLVRAVGAFGDEGDRGRARRRGGRSPVPREDWAHRPAFAFEAGAAGAAAAGPPPPPWYRSPWVVCAASANLLPWLVWAPSFNRFALSPSVCAWNQLLPGPLAFFACFAGSTQAYTTFWATRVRSQPGAPAGVGAHAIEFLGSVCAACHLMVFAVPRCIYEGHQAMVDCSVLIGIVIVALLESRERTRAGAACLCAQLLAVASLSALTECKCTAYAAVEVAGINAFVVFMAHRAARSGRFDAAEYGTNVAAVNLVAWTLQQYLLNFCITRGVALQFGGAAADVMPDRTPQTRMAYDPPFLARPG